MEFSIHLISIVIIYCISKQIHSGPVIMNLKYTNLNLH